MKYKTLETSTSLFLAYQPLAREYKRAANRRTPLTFDSSEKGGKTSSPHFNNYNQSFALLILNASILEGTLRSILSEKIANDIKIETQQGRSEGRSKASKAEQLLYKFRDDVEIYGGWGKLKEQYKFYLEIHLDKVGSKDLKEAIDALIVLRNIIAHGTAIVQPNEKIDDALKDVYPYSWQNKVHGASVYLRKVYGSDDMFENLAEFDIPKHFLDVTREYLNAVTEELDFSPKRANQTLEMINRYTFGSIDHLL